MALQQNNPLVEYEFTPDAFPWTTVAKVPATLHADDVTGFLPVADSAGTTTLLTDWNDGGRLDLILDATLVQATAAAGASGGTGARTVAITVNDGTAVLESAKVRLTKGAESYLLTTSVAGLATFSLDDGTWTVAITLPSYVFTRCTLVVDGNETVTYSMTEAGFTPSTLPNAVTIRWRVYSYTTRLPVGAAAATVYMRIKAGPGTGGGAWPRQWDSQATDANGYAEFPDVPIGATIQGRLGLDGPEMDETIPATATSPYEAVELWGAIGG